MNATAQQRRIIKAYADNWNLRYRITSAGEVHMHGTMPNSTTVGWYLFSDTPAEAVCRIQPNH